MQELVRVEQDALRCARHVRQARYALQRLHRVLRRVPEVSRGGPFGTAGDAEEAAAVRGEHSIVQEMGHQQLVCRQSHHCRRVCAAGEFPIKHDLRLFFTS